MEQFINKLKLKLKQPLPGEEAQFVMAPLNRKRLNREKFGQENFIQSAVMLLLCMDENDNLFIPLTQRFEYAGVHSAQVSFPGGKFDDTDQSLVNTALRECDEEIGIEKEEIEILGQLTPLYIPVSNYLVHPTVGYCNLKNISFSKNEREVKQIVKLFLKDLLDDKICKTGSIKIRNHKAKSSLIEDKNETIKAPYFEIENLFVWGATAMILNEFKTILLREN